MWLIALSLYGDRAVHRATDTGGAGGVGVTPGVRDACTGNVLEGDSLGGRWRRFPRTQGQRGRGEGRFRAVVAGCRVRRGRSADALIVHVMMQRSNEYGQKTTFLEFP